MLVLARKKNQSIIIGDNIEIVVVELGNDQVKIGINAPSDVSVHRREIYDSIRTENKDAVVQPGRLPDLSKLPRKKPADIDPLPPTH